MKLHKAIVLSAGGVALIGGVLFAAAKNLKTDLDNAVQTIGSVTISTGGNSATLSGDSAGNLNIDTNNFIIKNGSISSSSGSSIFGGTGNQISDSKNSTIVAGESNEISSSKNSFIGGGSGNKITAGENNAIPGGNSNTINGSYSVIVGNSNSLSGAHNAIVGQNNTIQGGVYSVVMGSGATLSASNSFLWSSGNKSVTLNQNDVFAVMGKMAVNTGKVSGNAGLHIGAPLIVSTGNTKGVACNSNLKGSLKLVKKYDSSDNSSFKDQMCLCSCNGSGWTSVENSKFCENPCTNETPYEEVDDNEGCGDENKVSFSITGGVINKDKACSGDYKLIEDSFLLSGQREDNMAKLWWACQNDYGKTVSCSKTFEYKCVKNSSYTKFTSIIPANAQWNNNVLPNSQKPVEHSSTKSDICSFSCDKGYSWVDDGGYDCRAQCKDFDGNYVNHNQTKDVYDKADPVCTNVCKKVTLTCKDGNWYEGKTNTNKKTLQSQNDYKETCQTKDGYSEVSYRNGYPIVSNNVGSCTLSDYPTRKYKIFSNGEKPNNILNQFLPEKSCITHPSDGDKGCNDDITETLYKCNDEYRWYTNGSISTCGPKTCKGNTYQTKNNREYLLLNTGSVVSKTTQKSTRIGSNITCEAKFKCTDDKDNEYGKREFESESCTCNATTKTINGHKYDLPGGVIVGQSTGGVQSYTDSQCYMNFYCGVSGREGSTRDENCLPACGTAHNESRESAPKTNNELCRIGIPSESSVPFNETTKRWEWTCNEGNNKVPCRTNPMMCGNHKDVKEDYDGGDYADEVRCVGASITSWPTGSIGGTDYTWKCGEVDCPGKCTKGKVWNGKKCVNPCNEHGKKDNPWIRNTDGSNACMPNLEPNSEKKITEPNIDFQYKCGTSTAVCYGKCPTDMPVWDGEKCVETPPPPSECGETQPWTWNNTHDGACKNGTYATGDATNTNDFNYFCGATSCNGVCPSDNVWDGEECIPKEPDYIRSCTNEVGKCINNFLKVIEVTTSDQNSYTKWTCGLQTCAKCKSNYTYKTGNVNGALKAYWMDNTEPEEEWGYCTFPQPPVPQCASPQPKTTSSGDWGKQENIWTFTNQNFAWCEKGEPVKYNNKGVEFLGSADPTRFTYKCGLNGETTTCNGTCPSGYTLTGSSLHNMACAKYTYSWKCIDSVVKCVQNEGNQVVNNSFCDGQDMPLCGTPKTILVCPKIEEAYCNNNNGIIHGCFYGPALKTLSFEYKNKDYSDFIPDGIKLSVNQIGYTAHTTHPSCNYTENEQILKFSLYNSQIKQDDTSSYLFPNECSGNVGFTQYKSILKYSDMQLSGMPVENGKITRTSGGTNYTLRIGTESECGYSNTPKCGSYRGACAEGTSSNTEPEILLYKNPKDGWNAHSEWQCNLGNLSVDCEQYYNYNVGDCPQTYERDKSKNACVPKAKYCARLLYSQHGGITRRTGNGKCFGNEYMDGIDNLETYGIDFKITFLSMNTDGTFGEQYVDDFVGRYGNIKMVGYNPINVDLCHPVEERVDSVLNEESFIENGCILSPLGGDDDGYYLTCGTKNNLTAERCPGKIKDSSNVVQKP